MLRTISTVTASILIRPWFLFTGLLISAALGAGIGFAGEAALGMTGIVLAVAFGLAPTLGIATVGTACGLNAVASISAPGRWRDSLWFALSVSTVAAGLGLGLGAIGQTLNVGRLIVPASGVLVGLGLLEMGILPARRMLTLRWQVPPEWVSQRPHAPALWGLLLGSGLTTFMPHPSYFGVLLCALLLPVPLGGLILGAYGVGRAIPVIAATHDRTLLNRLHTSALQLRTAGHFMAGFTTIALGFAIATASVAP